MLTILTNPLVHIGSTVILAKPVFYLMTSAAPGCRIHSSFVLQILLATGCKSRPRAATSCGNQSMSMLRLTFLLTNSTPVMTPLQFSVGSKAAIFRSSPVRASWNLMFHPQLFLPLASQTNFPNGTANK